MAIHILFTMTAINNNCNTCNDINHYVHRNKNWKQALSEAEGYGRFICHSYNYPPPMLMCFDPLLKFTNHFGGLMRSRHSSVANILKLWPVCIEPPICYLLPSWQDVVLPISNIESLPQADYIHESVSFTFIRLLPTWTPTEVFDSFWAKHFSYCDSIICPIKSKLKFLKVCKILKRSLHFQTDWMLCVLNCIGCSHVVTDAGSTCSCC